MNSTTTMTAAEFVAAFPELFQQYQNLILLATAFEEQWRKSDTAHFDALVDQAQKALSQAENTAERVYRARIADEFAVMQTTNRDAQACLNRKLSEFLTQLAEAEAPLLQERDAQVGRLKAVWASLQETCRELEVSAAEAPGGGHAKHQAALRAVDERCDMLRAPLRTSYSAQVAEAHDVYNAALAASRARYAEFENGVANDRKRAVALAERLKHDTLRQIAHERDEAADKRREWGNALKSGRRQAFVAFLQNPDRLAEREFGTLLRVQMEQFQRRADEHGWQLPGEDSHR
jgi:hypothetical protein